MSESVPNKAVWQITARYVAEYQAGSLPQLHDYLSRYPQYATEIADFVAYYHNIEARQDSEVPLAYLAPDHHAQAVFARALQRLHTSSKPLSTLFPEGPEALSFSALALRLDLSEDLLLLLERRLLLEQTLPSLLLEKLAFLLHRPVSALRTYLRQPPVSSVRQDISGYHLAEEPGPYAQNASTLPSGFLQALEASTLAPPEQKQRWHLVVEREQGKDDAEDSLF